MVALGIYIPFAWRRTVVEYGYIRTTRLTGPFVENDCLICMATLCTGCGRVDRCNLPLQFEHPIMLEGLLHTKRVGVVSGSQRSSCSNAPIRLRPMTTKTSKSRGGPAKVASQQGRC